MSKKEIEDFKNLKIIADKLKEGNNNEVETFHLRLPAYELDAIKVASAIEDKSINQWCRDTMQEAIHSKTKALSEMDQFKAKMTLLKEHGKEKNKVKDMGISLEL